MFKRFLVFALGIALLAPSTFAYRDVPQTSSSYDAVQYLLENELYPDGSFFRPDESVPAKMFWQIVLTESGFDAESATFQTPLPANVREDDPIAQYLREAYRRGFLDIKKPFVPDQSISRMDALRVLVKIKAINPPSRASKQFLEKVDGVAPSFRGLPVVEAAYASGIIKDSDIDPLRPHFPLKRRDLAQWLLNYSQGGEKKSSIDPNHNSAGNRYRWNYQRRQRNSARRKTTAQRASEDTLQIQLGENKTFDVPLTKLPEEDILRSVYQQVLRKYRFQGELTEDKKKQIVNAAIAGMVKSLDDKYSSYIEPAKSKDFTQHLSGKFEGIGAYVEMYDEDFTITSPIKGSPAEAAGILPGDIITEVDGESILGQGVQDIIKKIKGPAGTEVKLMIRRENHNVEISVIRGKITVPSVTLEWKSSVPIIGIHQFGKTTARDFETLLKNEILPKNPRGLVIDLRNNPGGYLTSAVDMGEFFLKKDQLIFTVDSKDTDKKYVSSRNGELSDETNIVVLINKGSASASEILSGMLQDYEKATVMGEKSHGKGTVQELVNYANGGVLKITVAKWLTPKGRWLQQGDDEDQYGVHPDIEIENQTQGERRAKIDKPLDRAVSHVLGR